jgi:hypothetical protein
MQFKLKNLLNEIVNEKTSGQIFNPQKNKEVTFDANKYDDPEFQEELYNLITTAYADVGGHVKVKSPTDVAQPDWNYWEGIDIHNTDDFDVVMFGQKTNYGIKFSGVGHDGSSAAKRSYLDARGRDLNKSGYYIEVSGKIAQILINKYNVPIVKDQATVEKVLGKQVKWLGEDPSGSGVGNGWYERSIAGHNHAKILLGRPKGI